MTKFKFSDGTEYDISGSLKKVQRADGWYLVGNGQLIPVKDEATADQYKSKYDEDKNKYFRTKGSEPGTDGEVGDEPETEKLVDEPEKGEIGDEPDKAELSC